MQHKRLALSSLLTACVLIIEILVIYSGEMAVGLTVISAIPIYIIAYMDAKYALLSYFCVAILLFILSPHQFLFFICTNGIIGLSLGICSAKLKGRASIIIICSTILLLGIFTVAILLGFFHLVFNYLYIIPILMIFCLVYTILCSWVFSKINKILMKATGMNL